MAGCTKNEILTELRKEFAPEIKANAKTGAQIVGQNVAITSAANQVFAKAEAIATTDTSTITPNATTINNASTEKPSKAPREVFVTKKQEQRNEQYQELPNEANYKEALSSETAAGLRNANGEAIAKPVVKVSTTLHNHPLNDPLSDDQISDYYHDEDGTITKSANINNTLKELDKAQAGDNFDAEWSSRLDEVLEGMQDFVKNLQDDKVSIKISTLKAATGGTFDRPTGSVEVQLGNPELGQDFRNRFTMTNQEVFLHEMVHAATDYIFGKDTLKAGRDPGLVNLVTETRRLYNVARKTTTWEDLLLESQENYTEAEITEAETKWNYIFKNENGHGLEEFMAHLMTNKQFAEAMQKVPVLEKKKEDESIVERITRGFRNLLTRMAGLVTTRQGNITQAGAELITKIMKAQYHGADKASSNHAVAIAEKSADFLGKQLDTLDKKLVEPVDSVIARIQGYTSIAVTKKQKLAEAEVYKEELMLVVQPFLDAGLSREAAMAKVTPDQIVQFEEAARQAVKRESNTQLHLEIKKAKEILKGIEDRDPSLNILLVPFRTLNNLQKLFRVLPTMIKAVNTEPEAAKIYSSIMTQLRLTEEGFIGSILSDFYDKDDLHNYITDSILKLTHDIDGYREKVYESVLGNTKEWFGKIDINGDKDLLQVNEALTDVLLRTDIQSLGLSTKELVELLKSLDKVQAKIRELSAGLTKDQLTDAKSMASYMVTGLGVTTNARNIAMEFGKRGKEVGNRPAPQPWDPDAKPSKPLIEMEAQIDELITYMALASTDVESKGTLAGFLTGNTYQKYTDTLEKRLGSKLKLKAAKTLSKEEYITQANDGVKSFMDYSAGMQEASKAEMGRAPHNIIKGYMKESYDNEIEVEFFPLHQRRQKEAEGYIFIRKSKKVLDSSPEYGMFKIKDTKVRRANGALGLQGTKSRGTTILDLINQEADALPEGQKWDIDKKKDKFRRELRKQVKKYNLNRDKAGMHPMYDEHGNIINFRINLSIKDKKVHLNMETAGTQNISRTYGTFTTADNTLEHNTGILQTLKKDFDTNYKGNEDQYITIEPESGLTPSDYGLDTANPTTVNEYQRMWARLPDSTKKAASEVYGTRKMVIRKDLLVPLFGYDELTVLDLNLADKMSLKVKNRAKVIERIWQDTMQIAKGNIVIKTTEVLIGNLVSNAKILAYIGVNPIKGIKLLVLGAKELRRYEHDVSELEKLKRDELSGLKPDQGRMKELSKDIANNSVAPLIEAGLYQSIVEDVSTRKDNNRVANFFNDLRDNTVTNETANTAIQYLFLTEKTKPFQQMLKATQVSDFYFRYAQYHDAVDNKGVSKEQALREVIENYINYEAPLNAFVKYGDRMGPFFFVTYFTRIQKVIKRIVKANPGRVGLDIGQQFLFSDQDDILDQSFFDKGLSSYNPMKIFGALWEALSPSGVELVAKVI